MKTETIIDKALNEKKQINKIEETIFNNFPELIEPAKLGLSVFATLLLKDNVNPVGINFEGAPSSSKTTILSFFYNTKISFKTDNFTPKSFVSHATNVKKSELESIDLLPKIKHKVLIVPELAPLFGKRPDDLLENMSILTRIFDGEGYENDTGSQGHRGYTGDYLFSWLGATTPISSRVWKVLGKLGARLLFYGIDAKNKTNVELINVFDTQRSFKRKCEECKKVITHFINELFEDYGGARSIEWDNGLDEPEAQHKIIEIVELMRRLRGIIQIWGEKTKEGEQVYSYTTPIIEEPERAISQLYNLARGHAIIHERKFVTVEDIDIVKKVGLSSMPYERRLLLNLLITNKGEVKTQTLMKELNCSRQTALRTMKILNVLGVVDEQNDNEEKDGAGHPTKLIRLKEEFLWLLE